MPNCRITLQDSQISAIIKMAEGNPGAASVMTRLLREGADIDPDAIMGGFSSVLLLDTFGIYGSRIWMLYKDACGEDISATMAALRSVQMGLTPLRTLNHAIDNRGKGLLLDDLIINLKAELPNFGVKPPVVADGN